MWIIYDIVSAHGGEVNVESELGSYSRLHIDLPAKS
jgi:signal transduction histidine kinase